MLEVDITIVGAGVVGLAVAQAVADRGNTVVVLEKEPGPGMETSSRNSEVIHAGIYYPTGSLKASLCVEGSLMLYGFCTKHHIPFQQIGKVIVASTQEEESSIENLYRKGMENGASDLRLITREELKLREPHVRGTSALLSPHTGILDTHQFIKRLEILSISNGCTILYHTKLAAIESSKNGFTCTVHGPNAERTTFSSRVLINSAGLQADTIASLAGIDIDEAGYRIYPVKGEYFRLRSSKQNLVNGLVYPIPEKAHTGLGIHVTKDLSGSVRFGPDARYVSKISYDVDPAHASDFLQSARRLLPFLTEDDLSPDMAGIRPKIQPPDGPVRDFVILHEDGRGLFGLVNLIGIESPGLTSCLAIGKMVEGMLKETGLL
jgi:L-2-hydroxyglutarate oxidase LhgO